MGALVPEVADLVQMFVVHGDELRLTAYRHIDPAFHSLLEELAAIDRPSVSDPVEPVAQAIRTSQSRLSTWVRRDQVQRATTEPPRPCHVRCHLPAQRDHRAAVAWQTVLWCTGRGAVRVGAAIRGR